MQIGGCGGEVYWVVNTGVGELEIGGLYTWYNEEVRG